MNELVIMEKNEVLPGGMFKECVATYGCSAQLFIDQVNTDKELSPATCEVYITRWDGVLPDGKRLAASTFNSRLFAMKSVARTIMENIVDPSKDVESKMLKLEKYFDTKKGKVVDRDVDPNDIPTKNEVDTFLRQCRDRTVNIIVEFLAHTGVRREECLDILLTDIKPNHKTDSIRIIGKGNKERTVFVKKNLIKKIQEMFRGKIWLFEHNDRQYDPGSITNRIKFESLRILHKEYTAHSFRHFFITYNIPRLGITKVSKYVGHSSTAITMDLYDHVRMTPEDILNGTS